MHERPRGESRRTDPPLAEPALDPRPLVVPAVSRRSRAAAFVGRLSQPRHRLHLVWLLLVLGVAWDLAILAAPFLPALAAWPIYQVGHLLCHQDPARSFWLGGRPLPICARCAGLHLAVPGGVLALLIWYGSTRRRGRSGRSPHAGATVSVDPDAATRWWRGALAVAAVPTAVSLLLEWLGGPTSGASRCLTAAPLGATAGALAAAVVLGLDGGPARARLLHLPSSAGPGETMAEEGGLIQRDGDNVGGDHVTRGLVRDASRPNGHQADAGDPAEPPRSGRGQR